MKVAAEFVTSATGSADFPKERLPELALAGRSNVGKSSVINALVRQKLARTSAAPGKTRLANFYRVAAEGLPPFYLVDLPGYGYARGGEASKREFAEITGAYFGRRAGSGGASAPPNASRVSGDRKRGRAPFSAASGGEKGPGPFFAPVIAGVLQLVDSRHPGLESDLHAWQWLGSLDAPRGLIATKLDKLSRADRTRHLEELVRLHASPVLGLSVQTGEGLKELWELIATLLRPLPKTPAPPPPPNK